MKKLFLSLVFSVAILGVSFGQAVVDQGVIPVSVTLNQILRLNITSGGNINFVINTLDDYSTGVNSGGGNSLYQTKFTVASSIDFDVELYAEDASFVGTDNPANTLALNNVGYLVTSDGTGVDATNWDLPAAVAGITNAAVEIVQGNYAGLGAGNIDQNAFLIDWRCGSSEGTMNAATLLSQSLANDRYTTNVFLVLKKHD